MTVELIYTVCTRQQGSHKASAGLLAPTSPKARVFPEQHYVFHSQVIARTNI